jgi:hypothetical protein
MTIFQSPPFKWLRTSCGTAKPGPAFPPRRNAVVGDEFPAFQLKDRQTEAVLPQAPIRQSSFNNLELPGLTLSNPDTADRPAASLEVHALCCCKSGADEVH